MSFEHVNRKGRDNGNVWQRGHVHITPNVSPSVINSDTKSSSVEEVKNQCPHIRYKTNEETKSDNVEIEGDGDNDDGLSNILNNIEDELSSQNIDTYRDPFKVYIHALLKVKEVNLISLKWVKFLIM